MCNLVFMGPHPRDLVGYLDRSFGPALVEAQEYAFTGAIHPNQADAPCLVVHEVGQHEYVARAAWFNIVDRWQVKWPAAGEEATWQPAIDYSKNPSRQNARDDKLFEVKTWKRLFPTRRCLVLANAFGEWQWQQRDGTPLADHEPRPKRAPKTQIQRISFPDHPVIALPGMWNAFTVELDGREPFDWVSCSIITTAANATMQQVHNKSSDPAKRRQPAWIDDADQRAWLDIEATPPEAAAELLRAFTPDMIDVAPAA